MEYSPLFKKFIHLDHLSLWSVSKYTAPISSHRLLF